MKPEVHFEVNGRPVQVERDRITRLSDVLREDLQLTGTKIGCNAGDCGACTVLLDDRQVCSCLVALGQAEGRAVTTVEGLARDGSLAQLQISFHRFGAAQCGICTPGMLMAATDLLSRNAKPSRGEILDGLGGVLCRCTGYHNIIDAVWHAAHKNGNQAPESSMSAVGSRTPSVKGVAIVSGAEKYGADETPPNSLVLRAIRSPHHHATFSFGDLESFRAGNPEVCLLTHADVPGQNRFGIYDTGKDQPVFAEGYVRYRGEAVCALVGEESVLAEIKDTDVPITWAVLSPIHNVSEATTADAKQLHSHAPENVLTCGRMVRGNCDAAVQSADVVVEERFSTSFVEHSYIEPEAGYARRIGNSVEIYVTTQNPYMDRNEVALILGIPAEQVRIIPSACGGGFGGKLDLSVQPMLAIAAWKLGKPVRCTYTRPESMMATTKRHPAEMRVAVAANRAGELSAVRFHGDFNTGAYASWGPTVANRVPVHAMGPYRVGAVQATTRAIYTNDPPSGAFRGFGVPQAAIALECALDDLARKLDLDPLEFRYRNAVQSGDRTSTGQVLDSSVGMKACLEQLRPDWQKMKCEAAAFNREHSHRKWGAGLACGWYGIGNTSLPNPSTMRISLRRDGKIILWNGAVDIGQGSNTIMLQICADALGVNPSQIEVVTGDTHLTADAGKTSASRQTFVSGAALTRAAQQLKSQILKLANACACSEWRLEEGWLMVQDNGTEKRIDLESLPTKTRYDDVLVAEGSFDPPITALDRDGQGIPYATYSFAAQSALVEVDLELGTTKVLRMSAAADVGRAVNPMQVEGQIHGGIAQGIGMALMEEYVPGRTENLHDYLIPTCGDVPPITVHIVEDPEPLGPFGAKGIGEPALVPTAPAILNAIRDASGVRVRKVPVTPDRLRAAMLAGQKERA